MKHRAYFYFALDRFLFLNIGLCLGLPARAQELVALQASLWNLDTYVFQPGLFLIFTLFLL